MEEGEGVKEGPIACENVSAYNVIGKIEQTLPQG